MSRYRWIALACACLSASHIYAQDDSASASDTFTVGAIRVEGLRRISEGTVYNYLPVNIGDVMDQHRTREAIRALYATGFFRDVELRRSGGELIVVLAERPSIESFEIKGNKDIKTEDLQKSLTHVGLAAGKTFNPSVLDEVERYLTEQYFARGKYAARIEAQATEVPDNKVKVLIDIKEGQRARIRQINIVGNQAFRDEELLAQLESSTTNWLSWYRQDDRYAKEALSGDIETLRSFYMDRGYADFQLESTNVAIAAEKDDLFITLSVREGEVYRISDVKLAGDLAVPETELERMLLVHEGETFSQRKISATTEAIKYRLGLDGYAFAQVDAVPKLDAERREVALSIFVQPGHRVYARRINFHGTSSVNDEVFRREMRQLEGGYLSNAAIERSKERLQRLPFVEKVDVETKPVEGSPDLVDVDFTIEEGLPGQFGGGLGYSESQSLFLSGNFVHSNFLGTGQRLAGEIVGGEYSKSYHLSHTDPYTTIDGVSRTLSLSYRDVEQLSSVTSDLSSESWVGSTIFSYPLTEHQAMHVSAAWQRANLTTSEFSSQQVQNWVTQNGDSFDLRFDGFDVYGTEYDAFEIGAGWTYDSRDRLLFPRRGALHRFNVSATAPSSEVEYFVASYDYQQFFSLPYLRWLPMSFSARVDYGRALGNTTALPPQRNFFVGGPGSIRGFDESSLGPRDSLGNPFGGDFALTGQFEIILPLPEKFASTARATLFTDFGQSAYLGDIEFTDRGGFPAEYEFGLEHFRVSSGVGIEWLSPMGLFRLSYAIPLRYRKSTPLTYGDELKGFQFSIGNAF